VTAARSIRVRQRQRMLLRDAPQARQQAPRCAFTHAASERASVFRVPRLPRRQTNPRRIFVIRRRREVCLMPRRP